MILESPNVSLNKSAQDVFHFLSDVKNFEQLMPDNINKFELLTEDSFLFALKGMPEIALQKKEAIAYTKIVLGAAGGKIDFMLTANISEIETTKTNVQLVFSGEFNTMMSMMIKAPISKFIETLSTNLKIVK